MRGGRARILGGVVVLALLATACGGGDDDGDDAGSKGGKLPECPLDALDEATKPVQITYWHGMTRVAEDTLKQLTDQFNASQDEVKVKLVNNSAGDQQEKFIAGLKTGDLPDVIQHDSTLLQQMVDTGTVIPVESCIEAYRAAGGKFDTGDFVPQMLSYYQLDGVQWDLPFGVATPVLVYNKAAFRKAGLDPDEPPATLEDYRSAAEAIKGAGYKYGAAVAIEAWHFEELYAKAGGVYVDHHNGRDGRATEVSFDDAQGKDIYELFGKMADDGLVVTNPREGPDSINNLLAIGNGDAGMTIVSSSALGSVLEVLGSGQYKDVELGVGPLPGDSEDGGAVVAGGGLAITARDPAKQAAGWKFISYLTSTAPQATWAAATGYAPVRTSAIDEAELKDAWSATPGLRVSYDQLVAGAENDATAGPMVGDMQTVRKAVEDALTAMFVDGLAPDEALTRAAKDANEAIASYNDRVGG
jgi:sn-glycerol 3-phosphate transport system substrate-binding protein